MHKDVYDLYVQGYCKSEIAEEFNLTIEQVNNIICEFELIT